MFGSPGALPCIKKLKSGRSGSGGFVFRSWAGALKRCLTGDGEAGAQSFAHVFLHSPLALLASDVAAPVVLAVAAFHHFLCVGVVASSAAHQVATVAAAGRLVALPGRRAEEVRGESST